MADFKTLGPKSTNSYLLRFVKGQGTEFIDHWIGKHEVNLFSVVQLSAIAAVKMLGEEADDDDDAVVNMARDLYPILLKRLEELEKITREKRAELQTAYTEGQDLVNAFLPLAVELAAEGDKKGDKKGDDSDSDSSDDEDGEKKEKKPKRSKMEKKADKLAKAMVKKASKLQKRKEKADAKVQKILSAFSPEEETEGDAEVKDEEATADDGDAENADEDDAGDASEEDNKGGVMASLATALNLDPTSPVMAAVLAAMAKSKADEVSA